MSNVSNERKIVSLSFSQESYEWLEKVKAKTNVDSFAEVVANALRLYHYMIEQTEAGATFREVNVEGKSANLAVFKSV